MHHSEVDDLKFLVVDDDFGSRRGMALTLEMGYPGSTVLEARSLAMAISTLAAHTNLHLVLLDLTLDDSTGLATLKSLKGWCEVNECQPRIVVVSGAAYWVDFLVEQCIDECATGFIEKGTAEDEFMRAVATTLAGRLYITERYVKEKATSRGRPVESAESFESVEIKIPLTHREYQILPHLARGLSYKEVARELRNEDASSQSISDETVRAHVQRIAWKIKVAGGERFLSAASGTPPARASVLLAMSKNWFKAP